MAHKLSFVSRGEAIVGGTVDIELRVDPDPNGPPMDWGAISCHFDFNPTCLEFLGHNRAEEPGELPGIWELMPAMGFYKHFQKPAIGEVLHVLLGPLTREPTMIPPGGAVVEVFSFKVLSATPSSITIVPSREHVYPDGFKIVDRTAVFRGKGDAPAGTFYGFADAYADNPNFYPDDATWDYPIDYVSLDVVPDGSQAPPPTPEENFIASVMETVTTWSDSVGNPHPINPMVFTVIQHFNTYLGSVEN